MLFSSLAFCAEKSADDVTIQPWEAQGKIKGVAVTLFVPVDVATAWAVLTDYDNLEKFVPGLVESRVDEKTPEWLILEQTGASSFLLFKFRNSVKFKVKEYPPHKIEFEAIAGDFEQFDGSWEVQENSDGVVLVYQARAVPDFFAPQWVVRQFLKRDVPGQLKAVKSEMLHRRSNESK